MWLDSMLSEVSNIYEIRERLFFIKIRVIK